ncbi:hypothetical protein BT63DRAFT_459339 [Microthyrium microscopicum]|uniref:Impact N-terminal domain-containing protein n=1 Tax=Microthyrium microscopicum TaxID=703497 RepID=A0A6A6U2D5_9PEZI|nr:hypothetical protein BT63DRAFT_459339 [Microthyrium microscopicum]
MSSASEIQALLRFLSQDAKVPIAKAMGTIKNLQKANLTTPTAIAASNPVTLAPFFEDGKTAKQVLNAAKRLSKKRVAGDDTLSPPAKKARPSQFELPQPGGPTEESLDLPMPILDEERIADTVLVTNRAPLVLAFGVVALKYTMPEQPLSSRLSLAQAAVSMNSRSKAVSLGIEQGKSADEEGWGQGQAVVKVMGRSVRTMKRSGWADLPNEVKHEPEEMKHDPDGVKQETSTQDTDATIKPTPADEKPALWALDVEALKKAQGGENDGTGVGLADTGLPIYTPQSARAYLMRAFSKKAAPSRTEVASKKATKLKSSDGEEVVALLLGALELLFQSWSPHVSAEQLDAKAWQWYVQVRPSVADGVHGWGAKGDLKLSDILRLRRT